MTLEEYAQALRQGRLVIYPTETLYALGCLASLHGAVQEVFAVKSRPEHKPLPLVVADWGMVDRFLHLDGQTRAVAELFWPGPLSVVVSVSDHISPLARDIDGRSAVRMTPHPVAATLCAAAGGPLVSSSANRSGQPPACRPEGLDREVVARAGGLVVDATPWPGGGLPSTLVEVVAPLTVRILRPGAVSGIDLAQYGVEVCDEYKKFSSK